MILSKNFVFVGLAFGVLSACPLQAKDIVIATSSMTLTSIPYLVAIEKKFFEKEGLAAQYVVMRSDLAVKGLITGDVDYNQSVSSMLRAGVAGAPLITVAGMMVEWFKIRAEQAEQAYGQMIEAYPPNGVVADEVLEKDLEIARQTGAIKNRVALSRVVDFQFVKEARNELSGKKP